jgi:F-type H+-transporting ATPase subunit gamma
MANLKAIRRRIKSVQSTKKITSAMRLVAAAKVRRAQMRVQASRPFTQRVIKLLREIVRDTNAIDLQELLLLHRRPIKTVALIIITSDRGLCGSYNTTVFRSALERISQLEKEGKTVKLITVGLKGALFFRHVKAEKLKTYSQLPAVPSVEEAKLIAHHAADLYALKQIDAVEVIGTHFISMLRSEVVNTKFLPIELPPPDEHKALEPQMLFEPDVQEILRLQLLPKYIENVIYQGLLEASAAELAARMAAMTSASKNAQELINALTLSYNKARQASITQELLEIVGGAEALKG